MDSWGSCPNKHCSSSTQEPEATKGQWLLPLSLQGSPGILAPTVQAPGHVPAPHSRESTLIVNSPHTQDTWPTNTACAHLPHILTLPPQPSTLHSTALSGCYKSPLFTITATQVHKRGSNYPTLTDNRTDGFLSPPSGQAALALKTYPCL